MVRLFRRKPSDCVSGSVLISIKPGKTSIQVAQLLKSCRDSQLATDIENCFRWNPNNERPADRNSNTFSYITWKLEMDGLTNGAGTTVSIPVAKEGVQEKILAAESVDRLCIDGGKINEFKNLFDGLGLQIIFEPKRIERY